jgi:hypothetical protein
MDALPSRVALSQEPTIDGAFNSTTGDKTMLGAVTA